MIRLFPASLFLFTLLYVLAPQNALAEEVVVPAARGWIDTGVEARAGNRLRITAAGIWSSGGGKSQWSGPSGNPRVKPAGAILPSAPLNALLGRIGTRVFVVGTNYQEIVTKSGRLYLSMNDNEQGFIDNIGSIRARVSSLPPLPVVAGQKVSDVAYVFVPAEQVGILGALALGGGRVQLSQTSAGTPLLLSVNGAQRKVMSYLFFGPFIGGMGLESIPLDLPVKEQGIDQLLSTDTGGTSILAQYLVTHSFVFVDQVRFMINNIHANFDTDMSLRLATDEVLLDVSLHSDTPALVGEGRGYTGVPFGIPLPLGWQDGLCPDVNMADMRATIHLSPELDQAHGKLHLKDPRVELSGDLSLTVGDQFLRGKKAELLKDFESQLQAQIQTGPARGAIEKAITTLLLGGRPNAGVLGIKIDSNGVETTFKK